MSTIPAVPASSNLLPSKREIRALTPILQRANLLRLFEELSVENRVWLLIVSAATLEGQKVRAARGGRRYQPGPSTRATLRVLPFQGYAQDGL